MVDGLHLGDKRTSFTCPLWGQGVDSGYGLPFTYATPRVACFGSKQLHAPFTLVLVLSIWAHAYAAYGCNVVDGAPFHA